MKGTYSGPNNMNICMKDCENKWNITLTGVGSDCNDVVLLHTTNSTTDRAIYLLNSTFSEISCMKISNFTFLESDPVKFLSTFASESLSKQTIGGAAFHGYNVSSILLSNVTFFRNIANFGAAVSFSSSNILMKGCKFIENTAYGFGGAVAVELSYLHIEDSLFVNNKALSVSVQYASLGGAIYFIGSVSKVGGHLQQLHLYRSTFYRNVAERGGGALYMDSILPANNTFKAVQSIFVNNSANGEATCLVVVSCNSRGGALYLNVLGVNIKESTFENNQAISLSQQEVSEYY